MGYAEIKESKLRLARSHIAKSLEPHKLCKRLMDVVERRKNETFYEENFPRFIRKVATQAEEQQVEQRETQIHI